MKNDILFRCLVSEWCCKRVMRKRILNGQGFCPSENFLSTFIKKIKILINVYK